MKAIYPAASAAGYTLPTRLFQPRPARTAAIENQTADLQSSFTAFIVADADGVIDAGEEDLAIADFPGARST